MIEPVSMEMDYLAALLHGRRSRMAEGGRLDQLCRIGAIGELARALYPQDAIGSTTRLQRRLVEEYLEEFSRLSGGTEADPRGLLAWWPVRLQVENLKVVVRGWSSKVSLEEILPHLIPLPRNLEIDAASLLASESVEAFLAGIPNRLLQKEALLLRETCGEPPGSFFFESVLDHAYLQELAARARGLRGDDAAVARSVISQEINLFHLMLAVRGKWMHGLKPELLLPLHVRGSVLSSGRFRAWLAAQDLEATAALAIGTALDGAPGPAEPGELETQAWSRLLRLANRAFRQGHMGMGAVVGYAVMRRVELANLITLSEGIRAGLKPDELRACMLPRVGEGGGHV